MIIKLLEKYFKQFPTSNTNSIKQFYNAKVIANWEKEGKKLPAPHVFKQALIHGYQKKFNLKILIESGTYLGDMIFAQLPYFDTLYSIELGDQLWELATKRFENNNKVSILKGDSGEVLHDLVPKLNQAALFWLDGHYSAGITALGSKECPIYEELDAIFKSNLRHVILIDDARLFIGKNDYPTIADLKTYVLENRPNAIFEVMDDTIRINY